MEVGLGNSMILMNCKGEEVDGINGGFLCQQVKHRCLFTILFRVGILYTYKLRNTARHIKFHGPGNQKVVFIKNML